MLPPKRKKQTRLLKWARQDGHCFYCKDYVLPQEATLDHLTPLYEGGGSQKKNLVMACNICNADRGHKHHKEYLKYIRPYVNGWCERSELELFYDPLK